MRSFAVVNGAHLAFLDQGAGEALLLLHGFPFSADMWEPQLGPLSQRARVIAPDLPGLGQSEPVRNPHLAIWADQVALLLPQLRVQRVTVCGLSMGGYVALAFARRHPKLLRALILANTRAVTDTEQGKANREVTAKAVEEKGTGYLVETLMPKLTAPGASPEVRARLEAMIRACPQAGAAAASRAMARRDDSTGLLKKLDVPVLVITGAEDQLIPVAESEAMTASAKQGQLVVLPGAGHMSNLEAPEAFNSAVSEFLRGLAGRST